MTQQIPPKKTFLKLRQKEGLSRKQAMKEWLRAEQEMLRHRKQSEDPSPESP